MSNPFGSLIRTGCVKLALASNLIASIITSAKPGCGHVNVCGSTLVATTCSPASAAGKSNRTIPLELQNSKRPPPAGTVNDSLVGTPASSRSHESLAT
jgi:hypothetical protein